MNIKKLIPGLCLFVILLCGSCIDDEGNYSYRDPESIIPIEITGLSDTTFKVLSTVTLTPQIKGMEQEENYRFTWYAYPENAVGYIPARDTLSTARNLSFEMKYPAGETYILVFEIRDKRTDLFVNTKVKIKGASEYDKGWFVMKDENDWTDIDFVFPDGSVRENILTLALGEKLPGTAVKMIYQSGIYTHQVTEPDGTVTTLDNKRALHILSSRDMITLNPDQMTVYKRFDEEFYTAPEKRAPSDIIENFGDIYLMNDGRIHSIYGMSTNIGKFGLPKFDHPDLYPKFIPFTWGNSSVLAFSRDTKSFVATDTWSAYMLNLLEPDHNSPVTISPSHMNADLITMVRRSEEGSGTKIWALLKSISGPEQYYLADISFNGQQYPFVDFDTIPSSRALVQADVYAGHQVNSIWFAKGNILSYYQKNASDADSYEKTDIYPFPAGETITYIEQVESPWGSKDPFNNLVVLTNSNNGWKLYRFQLEGEGTSPNILPGSQPVVYSGKGFARYVMHIE